MAQEREMLTILRELATHHPSPDLSKKRKREDDPPPLLPQPSTLKQPVSSFSQRIAESRAAQQNQTLKEKKVRTTSLLLPRSKFLEFRLLCNM